MPFTSRYTDNYTDTHAGLNIGKTCCESPHRAAFKLLGVQDHAAYWALVLSEGFLAVFVPEAAFSRS